MVRLLLCRLLMRTLGALVAVAGLTFAGWVYLSQPVESASTLNAKSGSPAEIGRPRSSATTSRRRPTPDSLASTSRSTPDISAARCRRCRSALGASTGRRSARWRAVISHSKACSVASAPAPSSCFTQSAAGHRGARARVVARDGARTAVLPWRHDHGSRPAFRAELKRLADEGAFKGIASTEDEREQLRAWLDAETGRIKSERDALEQLGLELAREREAVERAGDVARARRDAYISAPKRPTRRTAAFNEALASTTRRSSATT